jgi:hypothetical protein
MLASLVPALISDIPKMLDTIANNKGSNRNSGLVVEKR